MAFVNNFSWPHGQKQIVARHSKGGLINAIVESWYPADDHEWAVMLEDDIEVSPQFLVWANAARALCEADPTCIGVSLYDVSPSHPPSFLLIPALILIHSGVMSC